MLNRSNLRFLFVIVFILTISVLIITGVYIYRRETSPSNVLVKKVRDNVLSVSKLQKTPESIEKQLKVINDTKRSDKERFDALSTLAFYYSGVYTSSHDPAIREFSQTVLGELAKKEFPDLYNESLFNFPCADPECGMELSDEVQEVLDIVASSKLPEIPKHSITTNLTTAAHMPNSNMEEKKYGYELVLDQLLETGNPDASSAAIILRNYVKEEYNIEI